jgi:hypothetical protein
MKAEYAGYAGGCFSYKKKEECCFHFAAVKYTSVRYCWTQKLNREDYGVDKYRVLFFFF